MTPSKFKVGGHPATAQQAECILLALGAKDIKIAAGAGATKTTTLAAIAHAKHGKGLYITFSKDIADYAKTIFPVRKVKCRTGHSLAYGEVGKKYRSRLKRRLSGGMVAKHFNVEETGGISAFAIGNLAIQTINRFCHSADLAVDIKHVPQSELSKIESDVYRELVCDEVFAVAEQLFSEMNKIRGKLPITHDFYFKKWALTNPDLKVDYILMDESQDTNDVLIDLLEKQTCQIIWVGDSDQAIYGWRGAVNAMEKVQVTHTAQLTKSFRFGKRIAEVANAILEKYIDSNLRLQGFELVDSVIEKVAMPDAIICRTNAEAMRYMIDAVATGINATFAGGSRELAQQISALKTLNKTGKTNHVDFAMFKDYKSFSGYAFSKDGSQFKPLVLMITKYGFDPLLSLLDSIKDVDETNAELIITTAHKAKGLEWDKVKLGSDFKAPGSKGYRKEDGNLLYVAVTRAKTHLDISECKAALTAMGMDTTECDAIASDSESATSKVALKTITPEDREIKQAIEQYRKAAAFLESKGIDVSTLTYKVAKAA